MKNWSLKWQILALVLASVAVVVVSLTVLTITQMNHQMHASLERKAVAISLLLAENLGPGLEFADTALVDTLASKALLDEDVVAVALYDNSGHRVLDLRSDEGALPSEDSCNHVGGTEVTHVGYHCYVERPVFSQRHIVGCMWLVVTEEAMAAQLYRGTAVTIGLALGLLFFITIVGTILARRMTRPIQTFSQAAGRISSGDMLATVDVGQLQRDYVPLGKAFNSMQATLSQAFDSLKKSRDELESQVAEQTRDIRDELAERKKIELAVAEGRELLKATLDSTADGILVVDARGVMTHHNRRFAGLWQIPAELLRTREDNRMLAHVLDQLIDPQAFLDKVRQLYASKDESTDTLYFKDGRVFERYSCPLTKDDKAVGRVWSFRDITHLMKMMEKLQLTQFSIDHVSDPAFWMRDDGSLIYVNEAACRMLGYKESELLDMRFQDIDPNFPAEAWPLQWRQIKQKGSLTFCSSHRCSNGREYAVEIIADYVDFQGQEYICAFSHDIRERRRAEQAQAVLLRVAEAANKATGLKELLTGVQTQLSKLIDAANFYVALWDEEKQLYTFPYAVDENEDEDFSPQRLEWSLTDFVRRHDEPLLVDEDTHRQLTSRGDVNMIGHPSLTWMGIPLRATSGTIGVLVVQSYHNPRAYKEADLNWLTSVSEPVARVIERIQAAEQQQQLREELERAERMRSLGVMAGGVAHDLNNMLGPLVGYPELILMKLPEDSPFRKQIQRIGTAAKEAANVVQDLLTLARRGRYEMVPTDVNAVVEAYLDSPGFAKLVETRPNVKVSTTIDRNIGRISGSSHHLSKVIMNLIVNAFDAMPDGGTLQINTRSAVGRAASQRLRQARSGSIHCRNGEGLGYRYRSGRHREDFRAVLLEEDDGDQRQRTRTVSRVRRRQGPQRVLRRHLRVG